jgi:hypothetical protein
MAEFAANPANILAEPPSSPPAISNPREELTVAASPVRQTLQILGSAGTVLGFGISAAQDAVYAKAISDALGEYSPGTVFEQRLADALAAAGISRTRGSVTCMVPRR